jgi:hypothetical protein
MITAAWKISDARIEMLPLRVRGRHVQSYVIANTRSTIEDTLSALSCTSLC